MGSDNHWGHIFTFECTFNVYLLSWGSSKSRKLNPMGIFGHWPHEIHTLSESACNHIISGLWLLSLCIEAFALKTNPVQHPRGILDFSVSEDSQRSQFSSVNDLQMKVGLFLQLYFGKHWRKYTHQITSLALVSLWSIVSLLKTSQICL